VGPPGRGPPAARRPCRRSELVSAGSAPLYHPSRRAEGELIPRLGAISPRGWHLLAQGLAAIGFVVLGKALFDHGIQGAGGGGGIDAIAYLTAAQHLAVGSPLYEAGVGTFTAYTYPPPLAQILMPVSGLPTPIFVWSWRVLEILGLRIAVGSWTRSGIALLVFPPAIAEIDAANVHLIMAAVCALAMRGLAAPIAPAALLKFASAALVPLAVFRDWRGLLIGILPALAIVAVSYLLAPALWSDYAAYLGRAEFPSGWYNLAVGIPLVARLVVAGIVSLLAVRWVRLAPVAVFLAYPVVWFHGLSTLVAVVAPIGDRREDTRAWRP
jgi:hypothetical protein